MAKVTVLGLGIMGGLMARRIVEAGLPTTVWNRSASKAEPFRHTAATIADSPEQAVEGADIALTMLFDAAAVRDVMGRALPHLAHDAVWMQSSTVGVTAQQEFFDLAGKSGVHFVDAPMLGTKGPAAEGKLTALLAGDPADLTTLQPVVKAIATRSVEVGPEAPAASALKLAMNSWIATITAGTAQSLTIAAQLGVDPRLVLEAASGAAVDSPYLQAKGKAMLAGNFDPQFEVVGLLKDIRLARGVTPKMNQELLGALDTLYARTAEVSGKQDIASIYRTFQA